ncbi:hypothetical protein HOY82DRAFT_538187 [Tuber indicum]|nr:hypothetical protein HOY82DRAFT_538187 [Tuber indicum]
MICALAQLRQETSYPIAIHVQISLEKWHKSGNACTAEKNTGPARERPTQIAQPVDSDITFNLIGNEFGAIEESLSKNEPDRDANTTDSDVESDIFSETEGSTLWVGLPIPTEHVTAGSIKSAYRLLEAVDELESGMGMKSWKEEFVSFSEANSEEPPQQVYSEMHTADWSWETQDTLPDGATLVPIICGSDVTFLTNFSGDKKVWPIYMTIGNILSKTRNKASKHATILLALLAIPPKMLGVTAREARQRQVNNEVLGNLMEAIFAPMVALGYSGIEVECGDGKKPCDKDQQAAQELTDLGFKLLPSVFWGLPNVQQYNLPETDLLHVVYLGIFEAHLMKWVIGFLNKLKLLQSFDAVWKSLAAYPGYSAPNKEYSRISQWTAKEIMNLVKVIPLCFAALLRRPSAAERPIFTQARTCVQSIVDFTLMSQYTSHTNETIQYFEQFLKAFHDHKDIFKEYRKDKQTMRKVGEVSTRIRGENSEVFNQHRLSVATAAKRRWIADEQRRDLDGIVADIYDEDVDFNFVKIHL